MSTQPSETELEAAAPVSREALRDAIWPPGIESPTKTLACRHCGRKNRVSVPEAVLGPERHGCGACGGALFFGRGEPLLRLSSAAYEHGLDRKSLSALRSLPGFPEIVRWIMNEVGDRSAHLLLMSSAVRCGNDQVPELLDFLEVGRRRLDLPYNPRLFLGQSPVLNAMSTGADEPIVMLHSALLDQLSDDELIAVLGHELGHLHAAHPLYQRLAMLLLAGGTAFSGLARVLAFPLRTALLKWQRCAELTADRAAVLACGDLGVAIGLLLKFAGGQPIRRKLRARVQLGAFVAQARDLARQESSSWLDSTLSAWFTVESTHPFVTWRVMHLIQWVERGRYLDILAGNYAKRPEARTP